MKPLEPVQLINIAKYITAVGAAVVMIYGGITFHLNVIDGRAEKQVTPVKAQVTAIDKRLTLNELRDLLRLALDELYYWRAKQRQYPEDLDIQSQVRAAEARVLDIKERIKEVQGE